MNWQDISQTLYDGMTVWPGDAPFKYQKTADISQGQGANVGAIQTSLHAGTHIDAPYHIKGNGSTIDQLPLDDFIGPVQIIEVNHEKTLTLDFINQHLSSETKRLFIKTQTSQPIKIAENLANHLKKMGVILFGIDQASVDPPKSDSLTVHHALIRQGIIIIENLNLSQVTAGHYDFIGLPLKIKKADASPIRAAIRKKQ